MKNATLLFAAILSLPSLCLGQIYPTANSIRNTAPARKMEVTSYGANSSPSAQPYTPKLQRTTEQQYTSTSSTTERSLTARSGNSYMSTHEGNDGHTLNTKPLYVQDNGVRDNRAVSYTSPYGVATRNSYINPGAGYVLARFNPSFNRHFYYCTAPYTRSKCSDSATRALAALETAFIKSRLRADMSCSGMFCHCPSAFYPFGYPVCPAHLFMSMQMMPDNTTKYSNSGQFFSFDGYVVYSKDTLYGIVTITGNAVSVEYKTIKNDRRNICYDLKDGKLSAITVFKGVRDLNLVRLTPRDKHLHRVVHAGKLNIYDRSYSFVTMDNISKHLKIETKDGAITETKSNEQLAMAIDEAYGLHLQDESHNRSHLLGVMWQLD